MGQVSLGLILERLHRVCLRLLSVPLLRWPFALPRYRGCTWRYGCDGNGISLLSSTLSKQICLSQTMGASSWKAYAFPLGLSRHILTHGDVEDHGSPLPRVLGFVHSSISLDFRIHKRASKHPWLCFGSFLDVLIKFRSPWQAQARSRVLIVLNQPRYLEEG